MENKETFMKKAFEKKGYDPIFSDVKVETQKNTKGTHLYEKITESLYRTLKKRYLKQTETEKQDYIFSVSNGYQRVSVERFSSKDGLFEESMVEHLQALTGKTTLTIEEFQDTYIPVKVTVKKGEKENIGFSLLGGVLPKKTHNQMHKINESYKRLFDIVLLLAETIALNAIESFAKQQKELIRYVTAKHISESLLKQEVTPLPLDGKFAFDLIKEMKKFGFAKENKVETNLVDPYRNVFYLETDESGYIEKIEDYFTLEMIVPEFMKQLNITKLSANRDIHHQKGYAKSFQTKRNIHKKTKEKMQNNAFLTRYGYVEIDNDVDLSHFETLEEAYLSFIKEVFVPSAFDHSFRLKKLGKQKATGEYYSHIKSTILDTDHPEAYVHELGHQMDYTCGRTSKLLSEELAFRPIVDLYQVITQRQMEELPETDSFKAAWEGKGKYNKEYYFTTTEIFARCYELYVQHKGIVSPFLKEINGMPEYPTDDYFIKRMTNYFDELFKTLQEEKSEERLEKRYKKSELI